MENKFIIQRFKNLIYEILNDLSERNVDKLERDGSIGRLNKSEIIEILKNFNCKLINLPKNKFSELCPVQIDKKGPSKIWHLDIDLYCDDRESDLTLSLLLKENTMGSLGISILDLHVL